MVSRVIDLANTRLDSFIVGARLGPAALGFYGAGQRIHLTLMEALFATVNRVTLPAFARLNTEPERMQSALLRLVALCSFFSFPLFAAIALCSQALIVTLFGARWEAAAPILSAFSLGGLLFSVSFFNAPVMTAAGRTGLVLTLTIVNASLNAVGFWIGSLFGVVGVALAYSLRGYIVLPLNLLFLRRSIGMSIAAYLRTLWPSLAATILGFGVAWALGQSGWMGGGLLLQTSALLGLAVSLYLATMLLLFPRRVVRGGPGDRGLRAAGTADRFATARMAAPPRRRLNCRCRCRRFRSRSPCAPTTVRRCCHWRWTACARRPCRPTASKSSWSTTAPPTTRRRWPRRPCATACRCAMCTRARSACRTHATAPLRIAAALSSPSWTMTPSPIPAGPPPSSTASPPGRLARRRSAGRSCRSGKSTDPAGWPTPSAAA